MDVQIFFYKKGNSSWNALITTDMGIDAKRTFELYARRWCIEVAHKEMKGLLNLGKCQCVDFAGQIAALSLCMIQYNILGTVKRFESYETIGGLFTELTGETVELTVIQIIWGLIIKVINVIAEFISYDPFELTEQRNKQQSSNQSSEDGFRPARPRRSGGLNHLQNLRYIIKQKFFYFIVVMVTYTSLLSEVLPCKNIDFKLHGHCGSFLFCIK